MREALEMGNDERLVGGRDPGIAQVVDHGGGEHEGADGTGDILGLQVEFGGWQETAEQVEGFAATGVVAVHQVDEGFEGDQTCGVVAAETVRRSLGGLDYFGPDWG
jgi:hypothetical protein